MYLKVYRIDNEVMVAVCDEKYLGKEFSDGDAQLIVAEKFYGREPACCEEVVDALKEATIANLVGEESVACAVSAGIIDSNCVMYIADIPHAQLVCMP
ncbi:DUF424 domain-containing protein [Methanocella arvoryzae]|uniref:DUF424 domain-containing protein n=1 Tax=Methanocella arvoryzae (strain DSM 22066 / NBRC 105507 / MRE50) TaxID=351160 RepID=Q0W2N1_METAR|nr:DUF424 domain-containing protein [Methanocella arvoryzae]CAJ37362.1 conserved hypothetical protein [Methanocella arvoryzae MRE50]